MLTPAVFGIKNSGLNLAANLMILFLVVIWLALVYWTYADARRRIADPMLVGCAAAASLFPFVGTIVYMIVRPPEYLEDVRERELEIKAAEARLAELGYHLCPYCDAEVDKDFLRCPSCMRKLKDPCRACGRPLDPNWKICPFCETEVGAAAAAPRRTRRRRETAAAPVPPASRQASAERADAVRGAPVDGRGGDRSPQPAERPTRAADRPARAADRPARAADRPPREPQIT
jgi:hypothetical protein